MFDGISQPIEVKLSNSDEVFLGVDALQGYRLTVDFVAGTVTLERLVP